MRRPLWRGFLLALALIAGLTLSAPVDLSPGRADGAIAAGILLGALIAALPGRILRRSPPRPALCWRRCLAGFLGGFGAMLGAGLAGGGVLMQALLAFGTGGVGSAAFVGVTVTVAMICAWARRRELE